MSEQITHKVTYQDIQRVNSEIKTKPIKGKEYAEVPERVQAFRKLYPNGDTRTSLITDLTDMQEGIVTILVDVYDENGKHLSDGIASEVKGSSFINKTSYIENCQTSAMGRALGFLGIGSDTSIASAEEVQNAINNQQRQAGNPKPPQQYQKAKPIQQKKEAVQQKEDPWRLWKEKITPLWKEVKGESLESSKELGRRYKMMDTPEEYQVLLKSLTKEKNQRGESNA